MNKIILSISIIILTAIVFSGCGVVGSAIENNNVFNVQGRWVFTYSFSDSRDLYNDTIDIIQNGTQLTGTCYGSEEVPITGSVGYNNDFHLTMSMRGLDFVFEGEISGIKNTYTNEVFAIIGTVTASRNYFEYNSNFSAGKE